MPTYRAFVHTVQDVANTGVEVTQHWLGKLVGSQRENMQAYCPDRGTVSYNHQCAIVGVDCSAAVHIDKDDEDIATWIALRTVRMVVPKYELLIELAPGDIMTFNASTLYHGMVTNQFHEEEEPISVNVSLYFNR